MILSIQSTTSLEDVSAAAPGAIRWFNTYIFKQRDLTQQLVKRAEKAGYKAIVVTIDVPLFGRKIKDVKNHFDLAPGLTQLDGTPATIELLPDIVRAVGDRCEVYLDGGVRLGTDVTKALSLGARAVFVGRPVIWGLAYDVRTFFL
ncbi:hypothetical protein HPB48_019246 [Haemaphysalis longicornis]|uniref:FMN hydroxy acid dehydrogenase domain-containing protein n=1 Tax=Haemaphysalis longicornis TaxID=44386 RepID=A0A9J6GQP0_HAELO|nr:hypothetical protein HPB48_019246 [Haemaphysalis longicornis]